MTYRGRKVAPEKKRHQSVFLPRFARTRRTEKLPGQPDQHNCLPFLSHIQLCSSTLGRQQRGGSNRLKLSCALQLKKLLCRRRLRTPHLLPRRIRIAMLTIHQKSLHANTASRNILHSKSHLRRIRNNIIIVIYRKQRKRKRPTTERRITGAGAWSKRYQRSLEPPATICLLRSVKEWCPR
jgi:hypothetical protein